MSNYSPILGDDVQDDEILGTHDGDQVQGLGGNDQINGGGGDDLLYGDYANGNLLLDTDGYTTLEHFGSSKNWQSVTTEDGHMEIRQTLVTQDGATHEVSFDMAANFGGGHTSGAIEVIWNGEIIDTLQTNSGSYQTFTVSITGIGAQSDLVFRTTEPTQGPNALDINTDAPVWSYKKEMEVGGQMVEVDAFAPGQSHAASAERHVALVRPRYWYLCGGRVECPGEC